MIEAMLTLLALPQYGLSSLFLVAFLSATLLPMGSEPALLGLVELNPELFWPAVAVATAGNTLGGALTWWMGKASRDIIMPKRSKHHVRALDWLERVGPRACLMAWLPLVGDPLCAVAGWLKLSFWPCLIYMAIGKCLRYIVMTLALVELLQALVK